MKARTQAANQIRDLIVTAPDQLTRRLESLDTDHRVELCARFRAGEVSEPEATKRSLKLLARRHQKLGLEIAELDQSLSGLCIQAHRALLEPKEWS